MGYTARCEEYWQTPTISFMLTTNYLLQDDELAQEIRNLRFLVLDEADRMIEAGHFAELENILRLTLKETQ